MNIGIDEASYKKGHKYMTVAINHATAFVVWCGIGCGKEVLAGFFELLTPEQRKRRIKSAAVRGVRSTRQQRERRSGA